ncbi:MAG: DinB family protein [Planctomycetota bacterium]
MSTTDTALPTIDQVPAMLEAAIGQIDFTRRYTHELLDATPQELWYQMPSGLPTHVAWQVGHLAVSQYGLLMFRIRGRRPDDLDLIPGRFRKAFGRGGTPNIDVGSQPTPAELLERLNRVYELATKEIRQTEPAVLLEPVEMPYAAYPCKLGAVLFCPIHEQLHGGQIGLLRRALGLESLR